jgi:hypothetical protein
MEARGGFFSNASLRKTTSAGNKRGAGFDARDCTDGYQEKTDCRFGHHLELFLEK